MYPEITALLCSLGLTANATCFYQTACAVHLAAEDHEKLLLVTKRLYPEVASLCHTTAGAVERNLRSAVNTAWAYDPKRLAELAKHKLPARPTSSQFIAILASQFFICSEK